MVQQQSVTARHTAFIQSLDFQGCYPPRNRLLQPDDEFKLFIKHRHYDLIIVCLILNLRPHNRPE